MTTPGPSGFDYTDDSVIARVSFDIPPSAVTDVSQITQVMSAMRTELESMARAQSDWLDYLNQVPQIAERANQAFRDQITLMERMSYLQSDLKTSSAMFGGGVGGVPGGYGGGDPGGYSTAAPNGYVAPFKPEEPGMGTGPNLNAAAAQMAQVEQNPRAAEEMMAARGMALNPALVGSIGGAVMGALGMGNRAAQQQQQQNTPPGGGGGRMGAIGSAVGNAAAAAGTLGSQVWDEIKTSGSGARVQQILGSLPGAIGSVLGGGSGGGGGGGGTPTTPGAAPGGGWWGNLGGMAAAAWKNHPAAMTGAGLGLGALAFNKVQDVGERITRMQQLGSEEGGDWTTGLKEDLHARMIALDPSINTDQARKAISLPMQAGFQGDSRSQLRDELISNFKELGMSMAQSMKMAMTDMRGVDLTDENVLKSRSSRDATVNVLKEMAGDGGNTMALNERLKQLEEMKTSLNAQGFSQESIERSAIATQKGFDNSLALRGDGARITAQTTGSKNLMAIVGQKHGITGILPDAMPAALEEAGIDPDEARDEAAAFAAKAVSGLPNKLNRIAAFKGLMGDNGIELDFPQAKDLYEKVSGDKSKQPNQVGNKRAAEAGQKNKTNWNPLSALAPVLSALNPFSDEKITDVPGDVADAVMGQHRASKNGERVEDSFRRAGRIPGDDFAPAGQKPRALPQSMQQMPQTVTTSGQVQGEVRITVDQQGRVTAPPTIQLSGTQKAVNAGAGSAQLNNAPPGDPMYNHSYNPFPGG